MIEFPKISGVTVEDFGDPVAWKNPCSPLILSQDGPVAYATAVTGKRELVHRARDEGGMLLLAWAGQHRTDVFEVDDLERALDGLASPTGSVR